MAKHAAFAEKARSKFLHCFFLVCELLSHEENPNDLHDR